MPPPSSSPHTPCHHLPPPPTHHAHTMPPSPLTPCYHLTPPRLHHASLSPPHAMQPPYSSPHTPCTHHATTLLLSTLTHRELHTGTQLASYKSNASPSNGLCCLGADYLVACQAGKDALHFWTWHKVRSVRVISQGSRASGMGLGSRASGHGARVQCPGHFSGPWQRVPGVYGSSISCGMVSWLLCGTAERQC